MRTGRRKENVEGENRPQDWRCPGLRALPQRSSCTIARASSFGDSLALCPSWALVSSSTAGKVTQFRESGPPAPPCDSRPAALTRTHEWWWPRRALATGTRTPAPPCALPFQLLNSGGSSFLAPFGRHVSLQQQRPGFKAGKTGGGVA